MNTIFYAQNRKGNIPIKGIDQLKIELVFENAGNLQNNVNVTMLGTINSEMYNIANTFRPGRNYYETNQEIGPIEYTTSSNIDFTVKVTGCLNTDGESGTQPNKYNLLIQGFKDSTLTNPFNIYTGDGDLVYMDEGGITPGMYFPTEGVTGSKTLSEEDLKIIICHIDILIQN
jgi:hypothetical protein